MSMGLTRLTTLSVIYNFKEYLHSLGFSTEESIAGFPFIRVATKDQAYSKWKVPCFVIYPSGVNDQELQIGGGYWVKPLMTFDIYGSTDAQLLEMTDMARTFVETTSSVYRYDLKVPTYQVLGETIRTMYETGQPEEVCPMFFENRTIAFMDRVDVIGEARAHAAQLTTTVSVTN